MPVLLLSDSGGDLKNHSLSKLNLLGILGKHVVFAGPKMIHDDPMGLRSWSTAGVRLICLAVHPGPLVRTPWLGMQPRCN